ncbi:hypothetical protein [Streptomyces sp. G-G2]|uniref:hypothetical protein n=1 Tax=Streptomyces sp. G-G2 TaxID=3046201 RepID=UPI0024BAB704|nr:hypothetical protein [Streptomyces sp. G-G2]MDJ0383428.1 hypothetical protein [Streptomyces sp. G-G2]
MPRRDLPPPPPPTHLRAWLDDAVVRADRARFLTDLGRLSLGAARLLTLWLVSAVFALGWSFVGMALMAFEEGGAAEKFVGAVFLVLGAGVLVPAGFWFVWGAKRDREVRRLLCAWAGFEREPGDAALLRAPGRSLGWLLSSLALSGLGLWVTFGSAGTARPGTDTYGEVAYFMGLGMILWITGLLGAGKAAAHYRWALRALRPGPSASPASPARPDPDGEPARALPAGVSAQVPAQERRSASTESPPLGSG